MLRQGRRERRQHCSFFHQFISFFKTNNKSLQDTRIIEKQVIKCSGATHLSVRTLKQTIKWKRRFRKVVNSTKTRKWNVEGIAENIHKEKKMKIKHASNTASQCMRHGNIVSSEEGPSKRGFLRVVALGTLWKRRCAASAETSVHIASASLRSFWHKTGDERKKRKGTEDHSFLRKYRPQWYSHHPWYKLLTSRAKYCIAYTHATGNKSLQKKKNTALQTQSRRLSTVQFKTTQLRVIRD